MEKYADDNQAGNGELATVVAMMLIVDSMVECNE